MVKAAVLAAVRGQLPSTVVLLAEKADIFFPDRVGRAVLVAPRRVFLVVVPAVRVLRETVAAMTLVDL
tara:strand:- start:87 stop:290 length:204 start_codon:yes stop_codon:yes gene_type:complete